MSDASQLRLIHAATARTMKLLRDLNSDSIRVPACKVARFGPIAMQTARRVGTPGTTAGFEANAPLVNPGTYLTPNYPTKANPKAAAEGPFTWCGVNMSVELSWTYKGLIYKVNPDATATDLAGAITAADTTITVDDNTSFPNAGTILIGSEEITYTAKGGGNTTFTGAVRGTNGTTAAIHADEAVVTSLVAAATVPVDTRPVAGLYDAAIGANGGAIVLNNFANTQQFTGAPVHPRVGCELDIYDLTRGRSLMPNGRISNEVLTGLCYGAKEIPETLFPYGTEIEPRLYVTECRMMSVLDNVIANDWGNISVAAWVTLWFEGFTTKALT